MHAFCNGNLECCTNAHIALNLCGPYSQDLACSKYSTVSLQQIPASKMPASKYLQPKHLQGCLTAPANHACINSMSKVLLELQAGHQHGLCSWQSS